MKRYIVIPLSHSCTCYCNDIYDQKNVIEKQRNVIGRDSSRVCFKGCYSKDQSWNYIM